MTHPFLSVITINRNNAAGLSGTIQSVLTQMGLAAGDLEYIIIDGDSDDGSVDIIKEYVARSDLPHKIAYWVSESDTGIYNAMNKGIRAAHGEYVAILNSGDYYVKDALTGLKEIAQEHQGAILYGPVDFMHDGKYVRVGGDSVDKLPRGMIPHQGTFVPMSVHKTYGLYDESFKIVADKDLFTSFVRHGVPFFRVQKIIAEYDTSGMSSTNIDTFNAENRRVLRKYGVKRNIGVKDVIKLFVPYGLMLLFWNIKRVREKKNSAARR